MMDLQEDLKRKAIACGLCEQWQREWGKPDEDELINKFIEGIDFCIEHDYPTNDYIIRHFKQETLHRHGVYINEKFNVVNPPVIVSLGECEGYVALKDVVARTIYARHNSILKITLTEMANASVRVHDNAEVEICNNGCGKAYAYLYSDNAKIKADGDVVIRDRRNLLFRKDY